MFLKILTADIGQKLKGVDFDAVYTSDMLRAVQTAELVLEAGGKSGVPIEKDARLREWCLGCMEAENNAVFIKNVSDWLGGITSFAGLNQRLSDVADAIYEHDTTGMAEPFQTIASRLKSVFADAVQKDGMQESTDILIVTHAFAIKTIFHLFAPEQLSGLGKVKNASVSRLIFENGIFSLGPDIQL